MEQEDLKKMYEKIEKMNKQKQTGEIKLFRLEVVSEYSDVLYVYAKDKETAEELAIKNFYDCEYSRDVNVYFKEEISSIERIEEEWLNSIPFSEDESCCLSCQGFFEEINKDLPKKDGPAQLYLDLGEEAEISL
jgi:hypothetical protein